MLNISCYLHLIGLRLRKRILNCKVSNYSRDPGHLQHRIFGERAKIVKNREIAKSHELFYLGAVFERPR